MTIAMIRAPWTAGQIAALRGRQSRSDLHPYTCREHSVIPLSPTRWGWRCPVPSCDYRQDWAHALDLDMQPCDCPEPDFCLNPYHPDPISR